MFIFPIAFYNATMIVVKHSCCQGVVVVGSQADAERMHLNPVEYTIKIHQGVRKLARILKVDPSAISKWRKTGTIPTRHRKSILLHALENQLPIRSHNLDFGGPECD